MAEKIKKLEKEEKKEKAEREEKKPAERRVVKKLKAKKWFTILAPAMFGDAEIGRTVTDAAEKLVGRKMDVSMMELTGDFKKYYMKMSFRITEVKGEQAMTEFVGSECMFDYISRMVHQYSKRVDTVQDLQTKDGKKLRVKTITILPKRVKSSVQAVVRNKIIEIIKAETEASTLDEFIEKMISDYTRGKVLAVARKIYPIRNFEIRKTEIPNK